MNPIDLKWITHQPGYRDDPLQFSVGASLTLMDKIPKALLQEKNCSVIFIFCDAPLSMDDIWPFWNTLQSYLQ